MKRALLLVSLLGAVTACDPEQPDPDIALYPTSLEPPARTAEILNEDPVFTVRLSAGAVLAGACWDSCDYQCVSPELSVVDATVLAIRPVYRAAGNATEIALVGVAPGSTELTVRTKCAERTYAVVVLP